MDNTHSCASCFYRLICARGYENSKEVCKPYLPEEAFGVFNPEQYRRKAQ